MSDCQLQMVHERLKECGEEVLHNASAARRIEGEDGPAKRSTATNLLMRRDRRMSGTSSNVELRAVFREGRDRIGCMNECRGTKRGLLWLEGM